MNEPDFQADLDSLTADVLREENARLRARVQELEKWKESALSVEREWDEQQIARLLGGTLGQSCRKIIQKRVPEILSALAQAEADTKALLEVGKDLLLHISPTVLDHQQIERHNEGLRGMPQGPCQCVTCVRYQMHNDIVRTIDAALAQKEARRLVAAECAANEEETYKANAAIQALEAGLAKERHEHEETKRDKQQAETTYCERIEHLREKLEEQTVYTGTVCDKLAAVSAERDHLRARVQELEGEFSRVECDNALLRSALAQAEADKESLRHALQRIMPLQAEAHHEECYCSYCEAVAALAQKGEAQ